MTVKNEIRVYELNEKECDIDSCLTISSHWNDKDFVVIGVDDAKITVSAEDLIKAIQNATNW